MMLTYRVAGCATSNLNSARGLPKSNLFTRNNGRARIGALGRLRPEISAITGRLSAPSSRRPQSRDFLKAHADLASGWEVGPDPPLAKGRSGVACSRCGGFAERRRDVIAADMASLSPIQLLDQSSRTKGRGGGAHFTQSQIRPGPSPGNRLLGRANSPTGHAHSKGKWLFLENHRLRAVELPTGHGDTANQPPSGSQVGCRFKEAQRRLARCR